MHGKPMILFWKRLTVFVLAVGALAAGLQAQECFSGAEIDAVARQALQAAAERYFDMSAQGDVAGLKANAVPEVAANFGGIEAAAIKFRPLFAQRQPSETRVFLLDASNSKTTWQRADFYCGIYNSPERVGISIPNLPPGRYALSVVKVPGPEPITLTLILQESGKNIWKLGGYYARANTLGGHDGQWYIGKAREYKAKGQLLNAWFYYLTAWDLLAPVDFMSTPALDKLSDETQAARPSALPSESAPLKLDAGGKNFAVTDLSGLPMNGELYIRAAYTTPDAANPAAASADNAAVQRAVLAKYPELREAFGGAIARATDGAGHDFGTVTPMKDVK